MLQSGGRGHGKSGRPDTAETCFHVKDRVVLGKPLAGAPTLGLRDVREGHRSEPPGMARGSHMGPGWASRQVYAARQTQV